MKPGREFDFRPGHENFLCPGRAWFLLLPSWKCSLEVYVCCSLINKNKINLRNHEFVRKKQNGGWKVIKWPRLVLFFFLWSELIRVQFYFIFISLFDPSWSDPDWRSKLIRSDFFTCLAKMFVCPVELHISLDFLCGIAAAELHNSVDLLCGTTDAELHNSPVNLLCGTTDALLNNPIWYMQKE